ncbi:MAG: response regulator [Acetobacteraceae bacterium]|nr:response regulator [Acetobacteraceae bacterium]
MPAANSIKALVVDDQLTIRQLVRNGLQQIGITQIETAGDGEDGLRSLLTTPSNLVISDFNMPKLDGIDLLRAIRSHEPIRSTAFIMLTGRADKDVVQRAIQHGVNNFLVKPFTVASLKEKIEGVFGKLT